jgi:hypothetical protein
MCVQRTYTFKIIVVVRQSEDDFLSKTAIIDRRKTYRSGSSSLAGAG